MVDHRKKILITGAQGQVGSQFIAALNQSSEYLPISYSHVEFDITDPQSIQIIFNQNFSAVINCAAYTAVDLAESESNLAWKVNVYATKLLALACADKKIPLIHFSSDYVYDNNLNRPLKETDPCNPKSIYAITKYCGEQAALYYHRQSIIIRTSWVYSKLGQNFVNTILRLSKEKAELSIINDQIGAPTYTLDLVNTTMTILKNVLQQQTKNSLFGIYNFSNAGNISWFDFANEIIKLSDSPCKLRPVPTVEFPRPAARPAFSVFDMTKILSTFGVELKDWRESLKDCFNKD